MDIVMMHHIDQVKMRLKIFHLYIIDLLPILEDKIIKMKIVIEIIDLLKIQIIIQIIIIIIKEEIIDINQRVIIVI